MADLTVVDSNVALVRADEDGIDTGPAKVAITAGQAVQFDTDGQIILGDASGAATAHQGGVALETVQAGETVSLCSRGIVDLGPAVLSALDVGASVFLSDTGGALADAAGTTSHVVGTVYPGWGATVADKLLKVG